MNGDTFESTLPTGITELQTNDGDSEDKIKCSHTHREVHKGLDCKASGIYENRFNFIGN